MLNRLNWTVDEIIIEQAIQSYPKENERIILNRPTKNFFYDKWELNTEFIGTAWEKILASFPEEIGEARVIKLIPGETYMAHADIDDRWHLNLTGDRCYLIDLDTAHMHLLIQDGYWYEMDTSKIHVASNFGSVDRLQVVIRKLLTQTTEVDLVSVTITPNGHQHDYRYKFDQIVSPYLNIANKKSMLRDFKVSNEVVSFKLSKCELPNFKNIITENLDATYDITQ